MGSNDRRAGESFPVRHVGFWRSRHEMHDGRWLQRCRSWKQTDTLALLNVCCREPRARMGVPIRRAVSWVCLSPWSLLQKGKKGVWTLSTHSASDWAVHRPDRAGFRMFPGESSVCKGWSPVRVPPWAQHNSSSEGFLL